MDHRRLRPADHLTGIAGVVLILSLYAPWYGVSDGTISGWGAFGLLDLYLMLLGIAAITVVVTTLLNDTPAVPIAADVICGALALIGTVWLGIRLLDSPQDDIITGREWGGLVGGLAMLGVLIGSWWAMRDESAPGLKPHPVPELQQAPPPGAGPEPTARET